MSVGTFNLVSVWRKKVEIKPKHNIANDCSEMWRNEHTVCNDT